MHIEIIARDCEEIIEVYYLVMRLILNDIVVIIVAFFIGGWLLSFDFWLTNIFATLLGLFAISLVFKLMGVLILGIATMFKGK